MAKDVVVVVQRDALPVTKETLDILLISTAGECPIATYRDIDSVKAVFGPTGSCPNPKIVRKASTLFNQGKTTLADTLIDKVKIVGFDAPAPTPAIAAKLAVSFPESAFEDVDIAVTAGTPLWIRVGGEESATMEITATEDIDSAEKIAAQLTGTSFAYGGKTYTAAVSGATVTYTATAAGVANVIIPNITFYTNIITSEAVNFQQTVTFTNGSDAISAADNLINDIKAFQNIDNDWYALISDKDDTDYIKALAKFAEASEPTEADLNAGAEDHRKFYVGQTSDKNFCCSTARAAVIYTDPEYIDEEPDASYVGNVGPFYPRNVTWKFKRPQDGNAPTSAGVKTISLPKLTEGERGQLLENNVNFMTEEYKHQYVKDGVCLNGEYIDVILGGDWIAKRMRDLLYEILITNANIEYSDAGFGLIVTGVYQALVEATNYGIIAKDMESGTGVFSVAIPKYADSTDEQRRNRVMPDIEWEGLLAGAIHQVKVKGVLRATLS